MDNQDLRQRGGIKPREVHDHTITTQPDGVDTTTKTATTDEHTAKFQQDKNKLSMAKRGIRSLTIAVTTPLILTLTYIYFFGSPSTSNTPYHKLTYLPPLWILHVACVMYSALMGLSAWLYWAEAGLRRRPDGMYLYLAQMGLSLAWDPLVFKLGANWAGVLVVMAVFGVGLRCRKLFGEVNQMAGDVGWLCLDWVGVLGYVSVRLGLGSYGVGIEKGN